MASMRCRSSACPHGKDHEKDERNGTVNGPLQHDHHALMLVQGTRSISESVISRSDQVGWAHFLAVSTINTNWSSAHAENDGQTQKKIEKQNKQKQKQKQKQESKIKNQKSKRHTWIRFIWISSSMLIKKSTREVAMRNE
jgi:hypothetical protein